MNTVSVVIPSFNRADLLPATVRSVLAQSHPPLEVLVVDDGSTDDTAAVCDGFPAPVRRIHQTNRGLPAARNAGIREARGDWIALVDSDDLWTVDKLRVQLAAAEQTAVAWSVTAFSLMSPDGNDLPADHLGFEGSFPIFRETGRSSWEHFAQWLARAEIEASGRRIPVFSGDAYPLLFHGNVALPSTALISRKVIDDVGPFDETFRYAEDTEFFHRASSKYHVTIVMDRLTRYRVGHDSMIHAKDTSPFVRFAIDSLDRAAKLRAPLSVSEQRQYVAGRNRLRTRLAYDRLASYDCAGARDVLLEDWRAGRNLSPRNAAILAASLLPGAALRELHRIKRQLRGLPDASAVQLGV